MGKQTAVAMTDEDERAFIAFLRETADIQILESSAPSKAAIWVESLSPREQGHRQYYIWNKRFSWNIEYGEVTGDKSGQRQGWYYLRNSSTAPLIEYNRHNFEDSRGHSYGRVYWAKYFAAPDGLHYDVDGFAKWYEQIVRWIRRHGKQKQKGAYNPYWLPDAWAKYWNTP